MKTCPYCGEIINDSERICPFCYSTILSTTNKSNVRKTVTSNYAATQKRTNINTYVSYNSVAMKLANAYGIFSVLYVIAMILLGIVMIVSSISVSSITENFGTFIIGLVITGIVEVIMYFGYWLIKLHIDFFAEQAHINRTVKKISDNLQNKK